MRRNPSLSEGSPPTQLRTTFSDSEDFGGVTRNTQYVFKIGASLCKNIDCVGVTADKAFATAKLKVALRARGKWRRYEVSSIEAAN